ncbi:MAG: MerR family transcriptional regulator [Candidatus Marinimicrobia bacterium]|nr:MerR family transcriptional regulator [Candidatus Neomarinimicrobiota bacterium]
MLTTSQLARKAGVNVETLRYYERRGLIPEPPRRDSGYRQYSQDDVARIQFIKRAKELGFTLQEVQELLDLRVDPDTPCIMVKRRADLKIIDIEAKLQSLKRIKKALNKLAAACSGRGPVGDCPILEALGGDGAW